MADGEYRLNRTAICQNASKISFFSGIKTLLPLFRGQLVF